MIGQNNILNIRTSSAFNWNGQTGSTRGFANFESIELCRRAGAYLLMRSYRKAGCKTIDSIIRRWAPATENDTEGYIRFVSKLSGLPSTAKLCFDNDYASILAAMEIMENGYVAKRRETHFENARVAYLDIINRFKIKSYEG